MIKMDFDKRKKAILDYLLKKNIFTSDDILDILMKKKKDHILSLVDYLEKNKIDYLDLDVYNNILKDKKKNYDKNITKKENIDIEKKEQKISDNKISSSNIEIIFNYNQKSKKRTIDDFTNFYKNRLNVQKIFFENRIRYPQISINKIINRSSNDKISIIGMIKEIKETINQNFILTIEDMTGMTNLIITRSSNGFNDQEKKDLLSTVKTLVLDEVIAVDCSVKINNNSRYNNEKISLFPEKIYTAQIPKLRDIKTSDIEEYAAFIGDIHIGSKNFEKEKFKNLILWLNNKKTMIDHYYDDNEKKIDVLQDHEKNILKNLKYIFITGDVIDGIGIYPNQKEDLEIDDIKEQYDKFSYYIKQIPKNINIIIISGNHDAIRVPEPQPSIQKQYLKELYEMKNVYILSNPSIVNFGKTDNFEGFNALLYHGYSFIYYGDTIEEIRMKGGMQRADLIMKFLLEKRHLAPSHGSTLFSPDIEDNLIIDDIPDFFITGHIHRLTTIENYKGISLLNCSCWMSETPYQEKVGLKPQVAKLPIVNLKTRKINVIDFEEK